MEMLQHVALLSEYLLRRHQRYRLVQAYKSYNLDLLEVLYSRLM